MLGGFLRRDVRTAAAAILRPPFALAWLSTRSTQNYSSGQRMRTGRGPSRGADSSDAQWDPLPHVGEQAGVDNDPEYHEDKSAEATGAAHAPDSSSSAVQRPTERCGIVLLVDGDNMKDFPPHVIIDKLEKRFPGEPIVLARFYHCNTNDLLHCQAVPLRTRQRFPYEVIRTDHRVRDSTDMEMSLDALDLRMQGYRKFCFCSDDVDFQHVIRILRGWEG
eukprot:RCo049326